MFMSKTFFGKWVLGVGFFSLLAFVPGNVSGYEEIQVKSGGTLTGNVTLKGAPPPSRRFHLVTFPNLDYCGTISNGKGDRILQEFTVSKEGNLKDVVILFLGVEKGKAFPFTPEITLENCVITPFVTPVRNNHPLNIISHDPIVHDIQGYTLKDDVTFQMFNKPMPPKESAVKQIKFRPNHYIFRVQCGVHSYMQMWGIGAANPYFAVSGPDGSYSISDIPPGEYDVLAWHPLLKPQVRRVTISPNGQLSENFKFDSSDDIIPYHDLQTGYRFDTVLETGKVPKPTLLLQE